MRAALPRAPPASTAGRRSCSALRRLAARPSIPLGLRDRVHAAHGRRAATRSAALLRDAAIVVPSPDGLERLRAEAAAAGCAVVEPHGVDAQPELAAAALLPLRRGRRRRGAKDADARAPPCAGSELRATSRERPRARLRRGARAAGARRAATRPSRSPTATWIVADLHMHTSLVARLLDRRRPSCVDHAESEGLGAIAVTDHNVFGGALESGRDARAAAS